MAVRVLLLMHPSHARMTNKDNNLPMHILALHVGVHHSFHSSQTFYLAAVLLGAFLESVQAANENGRIPFYIA